LSGAQLPLIASIARQSRLRLLSRPTTCLAPRLRSPKIVLLLKTMHEATEVGDVEIVNGH